MADALLYSRVKAAARLRILALNLHSEDASWAIGESVYVLRAPTLDNVDLPCVQLTSEGESEELLPGTTEHRDVLWPVRVFLLDRSQGSDPARQAQYEAWRREIQEAFHDQRLLPWVSEVKHCTVVPQLVYDPGALSAYQLVAGSLLLKFWTREMR